MDFHALSKVETVKQNSEMVLSSVVSDNTRHLVLTFYLISI